MRLDIQRIRRLFAMLADLDDAELENWESLCLSAETRIISMLREDVNVSWEMERLCMAASALAYCDHAMLSGRTVSDNEIRVGDISVKNTGGEFDAATVRDHFLNSVADLIYLPTGFVFRSAGGEP